MYTRYTHTGRHIQQGVHLLGIQGGIPGWVYQPPYLPREPYNQGRTEAKRGLPGSFEKRRTEAKRGLPGSLRREENRGEERPSGLLWEEKRC